MHKLLFSATLLIVLSQCWAAPASSVKAKENEGCKKKDSHHCTTDPRSSSACCTTEKVNKFLVCITTLDDFNEGNGAKCTCLLHGDDKFETTEICCITGESPNVHVGKTAKKTCPRGKKGQHCTKDDHCEEGLKCDKKDELCTEKPNPIATVKPTTTAKPATRSTTKAAAKKVLKG